MWESMCMHGGMYVYMLVHVAAVLVAALLQRLSRCGDTVAAAGT